MNNKRRTQAERRAETHGQLLESACRLFGERGYGATSLEDIAADCAVTTRPIYHYFGNKQALFAAVNEQMEGRILQALDTPAGEVLSNWRAFIALCDDPAFRQVVLIDSPAVLGRERWQHSAVTLKAMQTFSDKRSASGELPFRLEILGRMIMAAFAEAAMMVAEAEDVEPAKAEATAVIEQLFSGLN